MCCLRLASEKYIFWDLAQACHAEIWQVLTEAVNVMAVVIDWGERGALPQEMGSIIALSTAKRVTRQPKFPSTSTVVKCYSSKTMLNLRKAIALIRLDLPSWIILIHSLSGAEEFLQ